MGAIGLLTALVVLGSKQALSMVIPAGVLSNKARSPVSA